MVCLFHRCDLLTSTLTFTINKHAPMCRRVGDLEQESIENLAKKNGLNNIALSLKSVIDDFARYMPHLPSNYNCLILEEHRRAIDPVEARDCTRSERPILQSILSQFFSKGKKPNFHSI